MDEIINAQGNSDEIAVHITVSRLVFSASRWLCQFCRLVSGDSIRETPDWTPQIPGTRYIRSYVSTVWIVTMVAVIMHRSLLLLNHVR